jgi:glycosyltransferase involved in cell wall biosynthesis
MTYEKLNGALSVATNSYGAPTGYGVQAKLLIDRLMRHGIKTAQLSNFGLEGRIEEIKTPHGKVPHYPRGIKQYSDDAIPVWHHEFSSKYPSLKNAVLTLYDVWVYNDLKFDGDVIAWTPLDHISLPPNVARFLMRPNVTPVTMSPHGQRQLEKAGIDSIYIPHAVDRKVMKPTETYRGASIRELLRVPENAFLVSIVAANKANGIVHRKAIAEQIMAFSIFKRNHPDAYLYLHSEPSPVFGGFNIPGLVRACGLDADCVRWLDSDENRIGYSDEYLAALYTASDVLLACSYGEGFGVPVIEAQSCGTRVISSGWAATQDLAGEDSWLVEGQPFWDEPQQAFYQIPLLGSVSAALELAYQAPRGISQKSIDFASEFDVERVWQWYWMPFLRDFFTQSK